MVVFGKVLVNGKYGLIFIIGVLFIRFRLFNFRIMFFFWYLIFFSVMSDMLIGLGWNVECVVKMFILELLLRWGG